MTMPRTAPATLPIRSTALTEREREIVGLVGEGYSNPAIAARLVISRATVKTHLVHIFAKLGVENRTQAAILAMELGLTIPRIGLGQGSRPAHPLHGRGQTLRQRPA